MALIKCPECGKTVSDKATACIHCGYPLENIKIEEPKIIEFPQTPKPIQQQTNTTPNPTNTTPQQNENTNKDSRNKGYSAYLIFLVAVIIIGMFFLTSGFTNLELMWLVFPLSFAVFLGGALLYSLFTTDPKEIKQGWDREKYNDYRYTCPMCGSKKVKRIGTIDRAASVAAVGLASGKIGKQYECDNCKHKW